MAHLITALILIPLLGALFRQRRRAEYAARGVALGFNAAHRDCSRSSLWRNFDTAAAGLAVGRTPCLDSSDRRRISSSASMA